MDHFGDDISSKEYFDSKGKSRLINLFLSNLLANDLSVIVLTIFKVSFFLLEPNIYFFHLNHHYINMDFSYNSKNFGAPKKTDKKNPN